MVFSLRPPQSVAELSNCPVVVGAAVEAVLVAGDTANTVRGAVVALVAPDSNNDHRAPYCQEADHNPDTVTWSDSCPAEIVAVIVLLVDTVTACRAPHLDPFCSQQRVVVTGNRPVPDASEAAVAGAHLLASVIYSRASPRPFLVVVVGVATGLRSVPGTG